MDYFDPNVDVAEMLELGLSHEIVPDELYFPSHPSRGWINCYVTVSSSGSYRMYLEGKKRVRFLLSAKRFATGSTYLISTSEDFPLVDIFPRMGYIAHLDKLSDSSYILCLNQCHLCDNRLGYFHCGRGLGEREVIAKMSFHSQRFKQYPTMEYRGLSLQIPGISKSGRRRVWCPRAFRIVDKSLSNDIDVARALTLISKSHIFTLKNKPPEWNDMAQSLVVRFNGNRILAPSAKNVLLCWDMTNIKVKHRSSSSSNSPSLSESSPFPTPNTGSSSTSKGSAGSTVSFFHRLAEGIWAESPKPQPSDQSKHLINKTISSSSLSPPPTPKASRKSGSKSSSRGEKSISSKIGKEHADSTMAPAAANLTNEGNRNLPQSAAESTDQCESSIKAEKQPLVLEVPPLSGNDSASISKDSSKSKKLRKSSSFGSTHGHIPGSTEDGEGILQFGKSSSSRYILDFRYPLSPLQAFGIAIASFAVDATDTEEI